MADVLCMAALKLCDPMAFIVGAEADNSPLRRLEHECPFFRISANNGRTHAIAC
jgi:hypothetical protein